MKCEAPSGGALTGSVLKKAQTGSQYLFQADSSFGKDLWLGAASSTSCSSPSRRISCEDSLVRSTRGESHWRGMEVMFTRPVRLLSDWRVTQSSGSFFGLRLPKAAPAGPIQRLGVGTCPAHADGCAPPAVCATGATAVVGAANEQQAGERLPTARLSVRS